MVVKSTSGRIFRMGSQHATNHIHALYMYRIALKFGERLGKIAANTLAKCQSDATAFIPNLEALRLGEIIQ